MSTDPYLYPGTNILVNKFNIKVLDELRKAEADFSALRLKELYEKPLPGNYDLKHFLEMHKYIFKDLYEWAGKPRSIDLYKSEDILNGFSIIYETNKNINIKLDEKFMNMKDIQWDNLNLEQKANELARCMADVWKIHPFREGNTRSTITFFCQYAEEKGIPLDRNLFARHSNYVRNSLVAATADFREFGIEDKSNPTYLRNIVKDSLERGLIQNKVQGNELER